MEMLLTVEQAAERLQVKPVTVRRQLKQGGLRGIRRGRLWRVPESALLESSPQPVATPHETPEGRAAAILAAFDSGDLRRRNTAIITLSRADAQTRQIVLEEVEKSTSDLPEDDGLDDWRALDSDPWPLKDEGGAA